METNERLVDNIDTPLTPAEELDNKIIKYMGEVTHTVYSDEQLDILKHRGGMCILASAGSGKTTTLNHLIAKRIQTGEINQTTKLLCTTFSKSGATEMGQRLGQLLSQLGFNKKVDVRTLHSVYFSLLKDLQYNLDVIEDGSKMKYIREACKENDIQLEDDEARTLESILSYQINNLMSDKAIFQSYIYTLREKISLENYSKIRGLFNRKKQLAGKIDFDDMQLLVYQLLRSEAYGKSLEAYCHSLWDYIYVDEAQDISRIQFAILKKFIANPNNLVIIGDDDQCIYQWRGADPSIILNICGTYPELTKFTLTTNYRCKSNIVDRAAHGIKFNRIRSDKSMVAHEDGGEIKVCDTGKGNIFDMSKYAYKYIKELVIDKGVNPGEIAVLSRNNQHLTVLGNMLFKDGIFCEQAPEMRFTSCSAYRVVCGLLKLADNTTNGNITSVELWKCCKFMSRRVSNEVGNIQNTYGVPLKEVLGLILTEYCCRTDIDWKNPGMKVGKLDFGKYRALFSGLSMDTIEGLKTIYRLLDTEENTKVAVGMLILYTQTMSNKMFKGEDSQRFINGYVEYMISLIENMGLNNFQKYITAVSQFEAGKMAVMSPKVTLSTIHGAKGKEWKYVIIFADDNVSFPSFQNIEDCIKNCVPDLDIRCMIDENRRLHYVAFTRAKEHLTIFGDKDNLSLYTLESLGVMDYGSTNDSHIIAMAQHGVYKELLSKSAQELFDPLSEYFMSLDTKNLKTNVEIKYTFEQENTQQDKSGAPNINDMKTYPPMVIGE